MARLPSYLRRDIRLLDVHSHSGVEPSLYLTHGFPFCQNLRDSHEQNVRAGVTHAVVFPWCSSLYYSLPALQKGRVAIGGKIGEAPFAFENDQLLHQIYEIFPAYKRMFIPFAMVDTLRETRRQVRYLEKLIERWRFYGLKVHPRSTQASVSTLGREGKPILEFARANDLPILFHSAYPRSPDRLSQISEILVLARAHPDIRFCAAHFCGFHEKTFDAAASFDNVWVDSAALSIGCDLVVQKSRIYESGPAKFAADYRDPSRVFAMIARRYPDTFMWGTDNPAHTWVSSSPAKAGGKPIHCELWSSMEREVSLLKHVSGDLRRKVAVDNALSFLEG